MTYPLLCDRLDQESKEGAAVLLILLMLMFWRKMPCFIDTNDNIVHPRAFSSMAQRDKLWLWRPTHRADSLINVTEHSRVPSSLQASVLSALTLTMRPRLTDFLCHNTRWMQWHGAGKTRWKTGPAASTPLLQETGKIKSQLWPLAYGKPWLRWHRVARLFQFTECSLP